ncbi:hypothetical protein PAXRUDRAFT_826059 [Paxillus rubicundulus Ve08.2h10]|uniref:Uncharacterized protein n=1 Tax=Paxillus rubicundulus Ve08.2h10 TaxID=930991 RepID=A0A0D0DZX9_9AGAM|nr:hypothetical protein PAXRUDRAFT_826059 [Paxillus rubicundulus Ve08.2h10]
MPQDSGQSIWRSRITHVRVETALALRNYRSYLLASYCSATVACKLGVVLFHVSEQTGHG